MPPNYVPFDVDERGAQALMNTLGEVPYKYAAPIVNYLQAQEQRAQGEWLAKQHAAEAPVTVPAPAP